MVNDLQNFYQGTRDHQINVIWDYQEPDRCLGQIQIDQHLIRVAGLSRPLPQEIIDFTIHTSPWQAQIKAAMRQHQSHLSLVYTGTDQNPVEKMCALYTAAYALMNESLLGILNENAWTAHPPANYLNPEMTRIYKKDIPFHLWMGFVKFFIDDQHYWLVTKGHHIFDVPDLAYFVRPETDVDQLINQFNNIFYYIYEQDVVVTAGDTLEIAEANEYLKFSEIPEGADFLMGPSGTLVIEKISPNDIAQEN